MHGIGHTIRHPIETSLSDGANRTHGSRETNSLSKFELSIINSVYSTQCRVLNIQPDDRLSHRLVMV